jgi:electron transport complex protein RnfG
MSKVKEFVVPTITLFAICLVASVLLGFTNKVTAPRIEQIAYETQQNAMKEVMPDAASFGEGKAMTLENGITVEYNSALASDGSTAGYAITSTGKGGYGGDIKLMVGVDKTGKVTRVSVLDQEETASIGGKLMSQESFLNRFTGIAGSAALTKNGGTVDAVSGATKTSTGLTDAVNNALLCWQALNNGEVSSNG